MNFEGIQNINELIKLADRRNLLPTSFEEFIDKNYGDFESYLNSADVHINEYASFYEDIARDELETDDDKQIENRARQLSIEDLRNKSEDEFYNVLYRYDNFKFPMFVYRSISLPVKNINEIEDIINEDFIRENVGIYWSYEPSGAISHWGRGNKDFILKAIIYEDAVNWNATLKQNMDPVLGRDEMEIRLIENTTIEIVSIEDKNNNIEDIHMKVRV